MDPTQRHRSAPATSTALAVPSDGSRTMTLTGTGTPAAMTDEELECLSEGQTVGVLRLRPKKMGNRVAWDEEVVDNEGAGKKKSKICCIYHKPRRYDESSDESSSSDSDSDSHPAHPHPHPHPHSHRHPHPHPHPHGDGAAAGPLQSRSEGTQGEVHELELSDTDEPNAYERPPHGTGKGKRKDTSSS